MRALKHAAPGRRRAAGRQPDLFIPPPMIQGETNASGRDVWYCRRRMVWTIDPADLFLDDAALLKKYGPATGGAHAEIHSSSERGFL